MAERHGAPVVMLPGFVSLELDGGFGLEHPVETSFRQLVRATGHALDNWESPHS